MCEKPGHEFAAMSSSGVLVHFVISQGFVAVLFLGPVVVYHIMLRVVGASQVIAGMSAWLVGMVAVGVTVMMMRGINRSNYTGGGYFKNESDSRYRVRAVIPKKRRTTRVMRWLEAVVQAEFGEEEPVRSEDLDSELGGFEPIIVRPWFGIKRRKPFWWTAVISGLLCSAGLLQLFSILVGGWGTMLKNMGLLSYATVGTGIVSGLVIAELIWPVYLRLVPGRLDIFRYGFLGSGAPEVETHDLKRAGVCMDFGSYTIAVEPEREIGQPLPALVQSKKWPHGQTLPPGFEPLYVCIALVIGRREIAERVIQAARTSEATPAVSETELGG